MTTAMRHRGPDGEGFWCSSDRIGEDGVTEGVAFGHRRLAIVDLREIANQPMRDAATGNVIVFNGEIYNYRELRAELRERGAVFETDGDTEVLLMAYAEWGKGCLQRLRGMFAFAIWDARQRRTLLVRDRLGIKPLYFTRVCGERGGSLFLFASELRALLASGRVPRVLDDHAVRSYLWHGFVPGPRTIVRDVELLEPGYLLELDRSGSVLVQERYWSVPLNDEGGADVWDEARATLREAIGLRMRSDVPIGVFLSGGIDSSVTTYGASRAVEGNVRSFTIGFSEQAYDETRRAGSYADLIGVSHTADVVEQGDFLELLPDALNAMDQPTQDGINSYLISRCVRANGIKVALSGTGGDELFGGYPSFARLHMASRWSWLGRVLPAAAVRKASEVVNRLRARDDQALRNFLGSSTKAHRILSGADPLVAYQHLYQIFGDELLGSLHDFEAGDRIRFGLDLSRLEQLRGDTAGFPVEARLGYLETRSFLADRVLRDADAMSMAVSLELRVPLLDHRFIEVLARFPSQRRYRPFGKKRLLRELGLPPEHHARFDLPKSGFTLPIAEWINDAPGERVMETLLDRELARRCRLSPEILERLVRFNVPENRYMLRSRVWTLFALMNWCRIHEVQAA